MRGNLLTGLALLPMLAAALVLSGRAPAADGPPYATPKDSPHEYVGVKKCGRCHEKELYGDQVSAWRKGPHAKAFEDLASEKAMEYAKEAGIAGSPQEADECLDCHVTGHGEPATKFKYDLDPKDGVQCESCHGPGSAYRKKSVMSDEDKAAAKGLVPQSEAVCVTCHNDRSPAWDPQRYTRADGTKVGFDYEQAKAKIAHPIPPDRKGHILELEKQMKRGASSDEE